MQVLEVVLVHSTKNNGGVDQNRMPFFQGPDRRLTSHCSVGNFKPSSEGLWSRKVLLNIWVSREGTAKSMKIR